MIETGGSFDKKNRGIYFLASSGGVLQHAVDNHDHVLVAVNELSNMSEFERLKKFMDSGVKVLIDSGVYALAMEHARTHGVSMDEALRVPIEQLDGFTSLYEQYCKILTAIGSQAWGYIEIDLGGREQKKKTRANLEALGLRPIPVYHILNDGWDYFDELAQNYDRICVGNLVHANAYIRTRILHTIWKRKQKYPDLWIHYLGVTPNEDLISFPFDSADSSAWLSSVRWSGYRELTCLKSVGAMPRNYQYKLGNRGQWERGISMAAFGFHFNSLNYRNCKNEYMALVEGI